METAAVERRLQRAAQFQAARLGFGFGDDSWNLTHNLIHGGVNSLASKGLLDSEPHLALAEANITALAAQMVIEAQQAGLSELRENTFGAAKNFLCPLWPFC